MPLTVVMVLALALGPSEVTTRRLVVRVVLKTVKSSTMILRYYCTTVVHALSATASDIASGYVELLL